MAFRPIVRLYGGIRYSNGIPFVSARGRVPCTREFVNQGGGEAHADLRSEQHRAGGLDFEALLIAGRAGPVPSSGSARLTCRHRPGLRNAPIAAAVPRIKVWTRRTRGTRLVPLLGQPRHLTK